MKIEAQIQANLISSSVSLDEILVFCEEAIAKGINFVCVPPFYVENIYEKYKNTGLKIVTVVSYPLGISPTSAKVEEIIKAVNSGVDELDVVINMNIIKSGKWNKVNHELDRITTMSNMRNKTIKIILDTEILTDQEIEKVSDLAAKHMAQYIVTSPSTTNEINVEKITLIKNLLPKNIKFAVSGKINERKDVEPLINLGADRIITSFDNTLKL